MATLPELLAPAALEADVRRFWSSQSIFARSLDLRKEGAPFVFYEGPPTANGMPHNGHVLTRVMKDIFPRFRTMRGQRVARKGGWDTHGLPVEVEVEKLLGIHGKAAIEAYGLEPFSRKCLDSVWVYTREWEELTERIGFWLDTESAYATYHRSYVESVWWALSELFKKGLLYQDYKVVWWWPQGGTALSAGEVGEGYKQVDDPSITVRFRVRELGALLPVELASAVAAELAAGKISFLAWTTTPWTLPSNVALAVNATAEYAFTRVTTEAGVEIVVTAAELAPEGERVATCLGNTLSGCTYAPLFTMHEAMPYQAAQLAAGRSFVVVTGAHVDVAQTGIVHTAPAFGEDDFAARKEHGLGFLQLVGPDGKFLPGSAAGTLDLVGRHCKEVDKDIVRDLKERGLLWKSETLRHPYPFCPRADKDPLIQYARPGWFIRTTQLNAEALANNDAVTWHPETIGTGRFGDFLRNNVDWALSRERFWGTPLNIWSCPGCDGRVAPASVAEIQALGGVLAADVGADLAVHKPWIDSVTLRCPTCAGTMARVPEVIDCWFDSGCMPFAQWGFPHQGREAFASSFPADFISEAIDQTRGWFYSLLMISTLLFDDESCKKYGLDPRAYPRPYRNCIVLGHVCDAEGKKESKSKGNYTSPDLVLAGEMRAKVVADASLKPGQLGMKPPQVRSLALDPNERMRTADGRIFEVVARDVKGKDTVHLSPDDAAAAGDSITLIPPFPPPGADAFRWLFYASSPAWTNTRISLKAILEGQREFLFRLRNVHQFLALHGEGWEPTPVTTGAAHVLDRWILAELDSLVRTVTTHLDGYRAYEAARALSTFVDGLSNWYLRRSRDRFSSLDADGVAARDTLYAVLDTVALLIAPFVPFTAEAIYLSLRGTAAKENPEISVHLADWPAPNPAWCAPELAEDMALLRELASLGLAARAMVGVRVRQPLSAAEVVLADPARSARLGALVALLGDELNVREVRFSADAGRFVSFRIKPDFKVLGKKLGKDMKACQEALARLDGSEVRARVLGGGLTLALPGGPVTLGPDEIIVEVAPLAGFQASGSAVAVVALWSELNEDLLEEGLAREITSKVQALRKGMGVAYGEVLALEVVNVAASSRAARTLARFGAQIAADTLCRFALAPAGESAVVEVDGEVVSLRVQRA
ncbi:isoleucine--tRNA ligase [Deltaproteobacteria bacterium]|nr:isoleucine--tRNA ligase [Deltaproteobacteria bacterium]